MDNKKSLTAIRLVNPRKKIYALFENDQCLAEIFEDTMVHFAISRGLVLTTKKIEEINTYDKIVRCQNQAYNYLQIRPHLKKELARKLLQKQYTAQIIEKTLHSLQQKNYINDGQFIQMYINDAVKKAKYGPMLIRKKLVEKGALINDVDIILERLFPLEKQLQIAKILIEKKQSKLTAESAAEKRKKLHHYATGRGFSWNVLEPVFNSVNISET